jgi:hypothetical protein
LKPSIRSSTATDAWAGCSSPFLFCAEGALREPHLYLSLYFKQHRQQYYDLLQSVRLVGDWEAWVRFFYPELLGMPEVRKLWQTEGLFLAIGKRFHFR